MDHHPQDRRREETSHEATPAWTTPRVEVISLSCEITAYAPDDQPLF
jgi:coenzyme PQQ precursor peptide PqqA